MLADDIDAALPELRVEAERMMTAACTITRAGTGKGPWNESEGDYDPPPRLTIYSGKCDFQTSGLLSSNTSSDAGERGGGVAVTIVKLPLSEPTAGEVADDDVVDITDCPENPSLVGRKPTIVGKEPLKHRATSHRFILNEVTR